MEMSFTDRCCYVPSVLSGSYVADAFHPNEP
jgi:hypothetical protein